MTYTPEVARAMYELRPDLTYREIGERFGVIDSTVRTWVQRYGWEVRFGVRSGGFELLEFGP